MSTSRAKKAERTDRWLKYLALFQALLQTVLGYLQAGSTGPIKRKP